MFANEMQDIGDLVSKITVADISEGKVAMPFSERAAWLKVQKDDKVHQQLSFLNRQFDVTREKGQMSEVRNEWIKLD